MGGSRIRLTCLSGKNSQDRQVQVSELVIAGWTGRDVEATRAHIAELEELGVPPPKSTPVFYRVAASLLTTDTEIDVSGPDTSGEVEVVIFSLNDGLWVGVGSDHTDRKAEAVGITIAKQACSKPIGPSLWGFDEVIDHWDQLELESQARIGGAKRLYQKGTTAALLPPTTLMKEYGQGSALPSGTAMFCGTLPVIGEITPAEVFELRLIDPVLGRSIEHRYRIRSLPVLG